ncbi:hypothetical protein J1605_021467 [Eschrichtius robustus]|uniref:ASCH domain-containing protein n=1 Tax=Eschrichtius robustus TaxID=9764 RepID=A0AB34HHB1_ESCRO|nr:hypothetical protein J1605_021467 [Eschrichtius robustus]
MKETEKSLENETPNKEEDCQSPTSKPPKSEQPLKSSDTEQQSPTSGGGKVVPAQPSEEGPVRKDENKVDEWIDQTGAASQKKAFHSAGSGLEFSSCRHQFRIQDQEFQEGFDGGWCLSMHQPWASLLVRGIKRVEGRSWYTPHRGRLWIAATAKRPSPQEVSELQTTYLLLRGKDVEFPNDYPSGCLLGCVDLTDCLSQKQFKNQVSKEYFSGTDALFATVADL